MLRPRSVRNILPLTLNAIGGYPDCPLAEEGEEAKKVQGFLSMYRGLEASRIKLLLLQSHGITERPQV